VNSQEKILSEPSDSQPLSAGGSPANLTVLQENVRHLVMTVISQENLKESFARLNPDGSLLRMSQGYAQANLDGFLENSYMIFPKWGIVSDGVAGKLPMSELVTIGNGSSLLPTCRSRESGNYQYANGDHEKPVLTLSGAIAAMLPTPRTTDASGGIRPNDGKNRIGPKGEKWGINLSDKIAMLPTTTSRDHKDTGKMENVPVNALLGRELGKNHGLKLQPAFAEWMIGFPEGWTALDASEMPSSRSKSTRSSKPSQILKEEI
jgi:hypothetical protein